MNLNTELHFPPNLLKHILQESLNEIYLFDGDSLKFLFVNNGALRNLGYDFEELQALTPVDIRPECTRDQFEEVIRPLRDGTEEKLTFHTPQIRKDGTTYDAEVHLQYFNEGGRSYFFAIILDVTDAKQKAAALQQALEKAHAANQEKDRFLASMSHELRTPLNAIIGFSQMMHDSVFGDLENQRYKDYIANIMNSADHLLEMVDEILLTRKLESNSYQIAGEEYDPVEHSAEVVKMFTETAREEGKRVELIRDETAPKRITADREVGRVIQGSLISDGLRHSHENGLVTIRWYSDSPGVVKCRIEDEGDGYPEHLLKSFGLPFLARDAFLASEKYKSFGLGLYMCKRYVEARGGELIIGNRENGGTFVEATWDAKSLQAKF